MGRIGGGDILERVNPLPSETSIFSQGSCHDHGASTAPPSKNREREEAGAIQCPNPPNKPDITK